MLPITVDEGPVVGYKRKAENLMENMVYDMLEDKRCEAPLFGRTPAINCGPTAAAKKLKTMLPSDKQKTAWRLMAQCEAIMGSCPKSMDSVRSGIRCWLIFQEDLQV